MLQWVWNSPLPHVPVDYSQSRLSFHQVLGDVVYYVADEVNAVREPHACKEDKGNCDDLLDLVLGNVVSVTYGEHSDDRKVKSLQVLGGPRLLVNFVEDYPRVRLVDFRKPEPQTGEEMQNL